ncbi:MAG: hypothetical protein WCN92_03040, partial [Eubacteriales bacterium]
ARYSLYKYLINIGVPKTKDEKDNVTLWMRFVYNIIKNNQNISKNRYDAFSVSKFFGECIDNQKSDFNVLELIKDINASDVSFVFKPQITEEKEKALLMLKSDGDDWYKSILEAELYYNDGQIGFLLDLSKELNNIFIYNDFVSYFELSKILFDKDKNLNTSINKNSFRRALLCMDDKTQNRTSYLQAQPNTSTDWGFIDKDYKVLINNYNQSQEVNLQKRDILLQLIKSLHSISDFNVDTVEKKLVDIYTQQMEFTGKEKWKNYFLNSSKSCDLLDATNDYKGCIYLGGVDNKIVLLLSATTVRYSNIDLHLYKLALKFNKVEHLTWNTTKELKDGINYLRYLLLDNKKIAYDYDFDSFVVIEGNNLERKTNEDIESLILTMYPSTPNKN